MNNTQPIIISIIEPTWDNRTHLPANLGLLRIVREAYRDAKINFVGGAGQIEQLKEIAPPQALENVSLFTWQTGEDKDTLPTNVYGTLQKIRRLPQEVTTQSTRIIFSSCTASILGATALLGFARKSFAILHGNANDLLGWRSRNPFRRMADFHGATKWFCKCGGTPIVLEDVIRIELAKRLPWISPYLKSLPHPITPEEATGASNLSKLHNPIRIAFAGNASIAKGFPEFLKLAASLNNERPGQFEFHAFGYLPEESRKFDQSPLKTTAKTTTLPRSKYVENLQNMDFIFAWHNERYYTMAASGIVYDAINFLVPLISRRTGQIAEWEKSGLRVGILSNEIKSTVDYFLNIPPDDLEYQHAICRSNIEKIRHDISIPSLGNRLLKLLDK